MRNVGVMLTMCKMFKNSLFYKQRVKSDASIYDDIIGRSILFNITEVKQKSGQDCRTSATALLAIEYVAPFKALPLISRLGQYSDPLFCISLRCVLNGPY